MSEVIENRVVEMRFDNSNFERNVSDTEKSLDSLNEKLKLSNGSEGLKDINYAAKNIDFSILESALQSASSGFNTLEIIAISALDKITKQIVGLSENILKSLFISPVTTGLEEYTLQMDSTQVIMSNTGRTLSDVTKALDELNEYADLTIYNFSQMTTAIGKFASAGVGLEDSVAAIKGLSNAAALVGANNNQLYSSFFNLSQSMQMGYLVLKDWRSIQNSTIGNKVMRESFIKTAIAMGKFTEDSEIAKLAFTDFDNSLQKKWLTTDVINKTLAAYTLNIDDLTQSVDKATGEIIYFNKAGEKVPKWMVDIGTAATKAATEVKSFGQMWSVILEEAQTGWADNWKIIIGDLNEAKTLWTNVSNRLTSIISAINKAVSAGIQDWKDLGGRTEMVKAIIQSLENLRAFLVPFFRALGSIIQISGEKLYDLTVKFREFTERAHLSTEEAAGFEKVLKALFKPISILINGIKIILTLIKILGNIVYTTSKLIFSLLGTIHNFGTSILELFGLNKESISAIINIFNNIATIIINVLSIMFDAVSEIGKALLPVLLDIGSLLMTIVGLIAKAINYIANSNLGILTNIIDGVKIILEAITILLHSILTTITKALNGRLGEALGRLAKSLSNIFVVLSKVFSIVANFVAETIVALSPILEALTNLLYSITAAVTNLLTAIFTRNPEKITEFLSKVGKLLTYVMLITAEFINSFADGINRFAEFINGKDLSNIGDFLVSSIAYGIVNGVPKLIKMVYSLATAIISTIRDTLQIHSPSPLFIAIGSWIPKSIDKGIEQNEKQTENNVKSFTDKIVSLFTGMDLGVSAKDQFDAINTAMVESVRQTASTMKVFALAFSAAAIAIAIAIATFGVTGFKFADAISDFADVFKGPFQTIGFQALEIAAGLTLLVLSLTAFAEVIKTVDVPHLIAIGLALASVVAAIAVISNIGKDLSAKELASLAGFTLELLLICAALSELIIAAGLLSAKDISDNSINMVLIMGAIVAGFVKMSQSIASGETKLGKMLGVVLEISLLISALTAMAVSLKLLDKVAISRSIFDIVGGISVIVLGFMIVAKSMASMNGTQLGKMYGIIGTITLLVGAMTSMAIAFRKLNGVRISKTIFNTLSGLSVIVLGFLIVAKSFSGINGSQLPKMYAIIGEITILLGAFGSFLASLKKLDKIVISETVFNTLAGISIIIAGFLIISKSMANINSRTLGKMYGIIGSLILVTGALTLMAIELRRLNDVNISNSVIATILEISAIIATLSGLAGLIGSRSINKLGSTMASFGAITAIILSLNTIILSISKISSVWINPRINSLLATVSTVIAALSVVAANIIPVQSMIGKAMAGMGIVIAIIGSMVVLLRQISILGNIKYDENLPEIIGWVGIVISALSGISAIVGANVTNYGKAALGIATITGVAIALSGAMLVLKSLSEADITPELVHCIGVFSLIIAGLSGIATAVGKSGYYGAIGAGIITLIAGSLLIAAEALKKLSNARIKNLVGGLRAVRDLVAGSMIDIGKGIILIDFLTALSFAVALLAPGMAILSVGLLVLSMAFEKVAKALHVLNTDFLKFMYMVTKSKELAASQKELMTSLFDSLKTGGEAAKSALMDISKGLFYFGASILAVGSAILTMFPSYVALMIGLNMVSLSCAYMFKAADNLSISIMKLANNSEKLDELLSTITEHFKEFLLLIQSAVLGVILNFFTKRTITKSVTDFAKAFLYAAHGFVYFGIGLIKTGQGLIWLAAGITVAKMLIGEDLKNAVDNLKNSIIALIDKFGVLGGTIAAILQIEGILSALSVLAISLGFIGLCLASFGAGLISVSVGGILLAAALALIAKALLYVSSINPAKLTGAALSIATAFTVLAVTLAPVNKLLKKISGSIFVFGLSLIGVALGLIALSYALNMANSMGSSFIKMIMELIGASALIGATCPLFILASIAISALGVSLSALAAGIFLIASAVIYTGNHLVEFVNNLTSMGATFQSNRDIICNSIHDITASIANGIIMIRGALNGSITELIQMAPAVEQAVSNVSEEIEKELPNVENSSKKLPKTINDSIVGELPTVESNMKIAGKRIVGNIQNGEAEANDGLVRTSAKVVQNASTAAQESEKAEEPALESTGTSIVSSIADGITKAGSLVGTALSNVFSNFTNGLDTVTDGKFSGWLSNVTGTVKTGVDTIGKIVNGDTDGSSIIDTIADKLGAKDLIANFEEFAESVASGLNLDTESANDFATALDGVGSSANTAKGTLESMKDTIKSQMKMFEKFDMATDMTPEELLENMKSNLVGVRSWSEGIKTLGVRGMNAGLMQYLAEMGPEGYKYVEAFLDMTEEEFASANEMFAESMVLPDEAANNVMDAYRMTGVEIVQAVSGGVGSGKGSIGDELEDGVEDSEEKTVPAANKVGKVTAYAFVDFLNKTVTESEYQGLLRQFASGSMYTVLQEATHILGQNGGFLGRLNANNINIHDSNALREIGKSTATFYIEGFNRGLTGQEYIAECMKAGHTLAATVDGEIAEYLLIHSPSRLAEQKGMYYVLGLAQGIKKYTNQAGDASEELGEETVDSLSRSILGISDIFGKDMDLNPTITPVLDLSQIESGASNLNAMLSNRNASMAANGYAEFKATYETEMSKLQNMLDRSNKAYSEAVVDAIKTTDQPINLKVALEGDAAGIFNLVLAENLKATKAQGVSPFMVMLGK